MNAAQAKDEDLLKELVLDEIATMIEENPQPLIEALREANVNISNSPSKEDLIDKSSSNLVSNRLFQRTIAQVLAERVGEKSPTQLADMVISNGQKKQLNYEIMFQLLMGECEKHILENVGNPIIDEFKNNILTKFSTLTQALLNTEE